MRRREFIAMFACSAGAALVSMPFPGWGNFDKAYAAMMPPPPPPTDRSVSLLSAPIELAGDWGHMLPRAADAVVERMRLACLYGRPPADAPPRTIGWVIVDIGERDWSKLAYQFGHGLGHRHGELSLAELVKWQDALALPAASPQALVALGEIGAATHRLDDMHARTEAL